MFLRTIHDVYWLQFVATRIMVILSTHIRDLILPGVHYSWFATAHSVASISYNLRSTVHPFTACLQCMLLKLLKSHSW